MLEYALLVCSRVLLDFDTKLTKPEVAAIVEPYRPTSVYPNYDPHLWVVNFKDEAAGKAAVEGLTVRGYRAECEIAFQLGKLG